MSLIWISSPLFSSSFYVFSKSIFDFQVFIAFNWSAEARTSPSLIFALFFDLVCWYIYKYKSITSLPIMVLEFLMTSDPGNHCYAHKLIDKVHRHLCSLLSLVLWRPPFKIHFPFNLYVPVTVIFSISAFLIHKWKQPFKLLFHLWSSHPMEL